MRVITRKLGRFSFALTVPLSHAKLIADQVSAHFLDHPTTEDADIHLFVLERLPDVVRNHRFGFEFAA